MVRPDVPLLDAVMGKNVTIHIADGKELKSCLEGKLSIMAPIASNRPGARITLNRVLSHSSLKVNLLSVLILCKNNVDVTFNETECVATRRGTNEVLFIAPKGEDGVCRLITRIDDRVEERSERYMSYSAVVARLATATQERKKKKIESSQAAPSSSAPPSPPTPSEDEESEDSDAGHSEETKPTSSPSRSKIMIHTNTPEEQVWHDRLGHLSITSTNNLIRKQGALGITGMKTRVSTGICPHCATGKSHRQMFGKSIPWRYHATQPLERIAADVCGPLPVTVLGHKYILVIMDEYTRMVHIQPMQEKSQSTGLIKSFIMWSEKYHSYSRKDSPTVKELHTDGGGEFVNHELNDWLERKYIKHTLTQPHTPQQNGMVERANRTLLEGARAMMHRANAPYGFWALAVDAYCFIRNRVSIRENGQGRTPYSMWTKGNHKYDIRNLRTWGCDVWVHENRTEQVNKLASRSWRGTFVGYSDIRLGYVIMYKDGKVVTTRDVTFEEDKFENIKKIVFLPVKGVNLIDEPKIAANISFDSLLNAFYRGYRLYVESRDGPYLNQAVIQTNQDDIEREKGTGQVPPTNDMEPPSQDDPLGDGPPVDARQRYIDGYNREKPLADVIDPPANPIADEAVPEVAPPPPSATVEAPPTSQSHSPPANPDDNHGMEDQPAALNQEEDDFDDDAYDRSGANEDWEPTESNHTPNEASESYGTAPPQSMANSEVHLGRATMNMASTRGERVIPYPDSTHRRSTREKTATVIPFIEHYKGENFMLRDSLKQYAIDNERTANQAATSASSSSAAPATPLSPSVTPPSRAPLPRPASVGTKPPMTNKPIARTSLGSAGRVLNAATKPKLAPALGGGAKRKAVGLMAMVYSEDFVTMSKEAFAFSTIEESKENYIDEEEDEEEEEEKECGQNKMQLKEIRELSYFGVSEQDHANYWSGSLTMSHRAYSSLMTAEPDPTTWEEALRSKNREGWIAAAEREFTSLQEHSVFQVCMLPEHRRAIGCKMVFKTKFEANGDIAKLKCRFVAKGFAQREGIDYNETFAPVLHYKTLRLLINIATCLDMEIKQGDVPTAFLNATCNEELYMKIPEGMKDKHPPGSVYRLLKTLYGIKQAPRAWNEDLNNSIMAMGYKRCMKDSCVYIKTSQTGKQIIIPVFVDDLFPMCMTVDLAEMEADLEKLKSKYKIPSFDEASVVLGMRIRRDRANRITTMDQELYVNQLLVHYDMDKCKPSSTPSTTKEVVVAAGMEKEDVEHLKSIREHNEDMLNEPDTVDGQYERYGSLVGALMYAALSTRPDIAHATSMRARYLIKPTKSDWVAAKSILRYLRGTSHVGLTFGGQFDESSTLGPAYCDSNWGGNSGTDRKSTTGFIIKMNGGAISWGSKKQPVVATSTAEAEYIAAGLVSQEAMWTRQLMEEMGFMQPEPTLVLSDNQPAIAIATDDIHHGRTKHIDIKYHYIKQLVQEKKVKLGYVPSGDQQADILTKPLGATLFSRLRDKIMYGLVPPPSRK